MATDNIVLGGLDAIEGKALALPSHQAEVVNDKIDKSRNDAVTTDDDILEQDVKTGQGLSYNDEKKGDPDNEDAIIVTGYDAAQHLLPLRDDFEPALTFRSIVIASCLSAFQAVMSQIYTVSVVDFRERYDSDLLLHVVQTNPGHYFWNLHSAHRLLCRQSMGVCPSSR